MERTQYDWQHQYLVTPQEFNISANEAHSTYDQFIQLRDTLIHSWKYYNDKAGKRLIVWDKWDWTTTNTIEIEEYQYFKQSFEPWYESDSEKIKTQNLGKYVTQWAEWQTPTIPDLTCTINKDWHYWIQWKVELYQLTNQISKIYGYVNHHHQKINEQWQTEWQEIPRAVFDYEWSFTKEFTWSTTWTDPNGSCKVTVSFNIWDVFQKITPMWYIDADMVKWDWLEFVIEDQNWNRIDSTTYMQPNSNWWSVTYMWTPYEKI